jgi:hypothetical protein
MSKVTRESEEEIDEFLNEVDWADEDYAFIIGPEGKLKSVLLPETGSFTAPKSVQKILKIFGVRDIDDIDNDATLH